jgi:hypothetical protein
MVAAIASNNKNITACKRFFQNITGHFTFIIPSGSQKLLIPITMKYILFLLTLVLVNNINGQTTEDSVKAAVNQLFIAMKNADSTAIRLAFEDGALLQTISRNKEGKLLVRNEPISGFAEVIAKLNKGAADERIEFEAIKIDGPLAAVWTPYKFFLNGQFSHCGVNSFQLVRLNGQWKIQYIIDTRRKDKCN